MSITWAEVGLFKGAPAFNGAATLTRLGFTNVAATFNGTGVKTTTVTGTVNVGDDLWAAWGAQATTPFQGRGTLADELQGGTIQQLAGRISTATSPTAWTLSAATLVPLWVLPSLVGVTGDYFGTAPPAVAMPVITQPINATAVTTNVTNVSYAVYLGRALVKATSVKLLCKITTATA